MWRVADGLLVNIPVLGYYRLTWERTVMDNVCPDVNFGSNHKDSLYRQIRRGVYSMCDGT